MKLRMLRSENLTVIGAVVVESIGTAKTREGQILRTMDVARHMLQLYHCEACTLCRFFLRTLFCSR